MKISKVTTNVVVMPLERPFVSGSLLRRVEELPFVILNVATDDGVEGLGYAFSLSQRAFPPIKAAVDELAEELVGENPLEIEAILRKLRGVSAYGGPGGVISMAIAAIAIALWDILGKACGQPVYWLLGGHRSRVPCYYSGALWRDYSLKELEDEAPAIVERGFKAMKMGMGGQNPEEELERARIVRDAIGYDIDLMVDINQGWTPYHAIRMGRKLEPYGFYWLEDPVNHQDISGSAEVAAALDMPVCAGEYHYGKEPFLGLLNARAMDIVMIDILRVGGITQWRKVVALAETFNVQVVNHLMPEVAVHLLAGAPNGLTVEYMPWSLPLFKETPTVENGEMVLSHEPGLGLELDEQAIRKWIV